MDFQMDGVFQPAKFDTGRSQHPLGSDIIVSPVGGKVRKYVIMNGQSVNVNL